MMNGWIGVDLDRTLAVYDKWVHQFHIGDPIPEMVERIKLWLEDGWEVRIFTARANRHPSQTVEEWKQVQRLISEWCLEHIGVALKITATKDYEMMELWDDRCVRVKPNTGQPCCDHPPLSETAHA